MLLPPRHPSRCHREIALSLGVDDPSEILFITDLLAEAEAARRSGLRAILSVRPGNSPLPEVSQATRTHARLCQPHAWG